MERLEENVALRIRQARKARSMQQQVLADLVGVTRTSISNIENGRQALSLSLFCKITSVLDYKPSEFLERAMRQNRKFGISRHEVEDDLIRKIINETIKTIGEGKNNAS